MYCTKCGKEIKDNAKFCTYCGAQVVIEDLTTGEEAECYKEGEDNNKSIAWLRIFWGIVSIVFWCVIFEVFFDIFHAKEKDFRSWYNMYDNYDSINPIPKIIFYGVIIGVGIFAIIGIVAAIKKNRKLDKCSMAGCLIIIIVFFMMRRYVDATENHFLDTANIYLRYVANAVYTENIENSIYLYLGLNFLIIKFKQMAGKY